MTFFLMHQIFAGKSLLRPVHYEPIGYGRRVWKVREIVLFVPTAVAQFCLLELQLAREIVCREAHHQATWIGPRLGSKVADVCDAKMCLFPNLSLNAFFQRFACLDEACHKSVMPIPKGVSMNHEYLITTRHTNDNGSCEAWPKLLSAFLTFLADFRLPTHLATANATELAILMEIDQLGTLPCKLIVFGRKDVEAFAKRNHLQVRPISNGGRERSNKNRPSPNLSL